MIPKQEGARSVRATGKGGRIHGETYEEQPLDCWDEERQLVMHGSRFWAATPPIAAARTKEAKANFIVLAGGEGTQARGGRAVTQKRVDERVEAKRGRRQRAGTEFYTGTRLADVRSRRVDGHRWGREGRPSPLRPLLGRQICPSASGASASYGQRPALEGAVRRCIAIPRQHMSCYGTSAQKGVTEKDGRQWQTDATRFHAGVDGWRMSVAADSLSVCPRRVGACSRRAGRSRI